MSGHYKQSKVCGTCGKEYRPKALKQISCSGACRGLAQRKAAQARFWERMDKTGSCWLWRGAVTTHGYGCVKWDERVLGAHKVAYTLVKGEVPAGMQIRHSCDTRLCCNPEHLEIGTHIDNMADMAARGRGQKDGKRILTAEAVREIRAAHGKESSGTLSKRFNVQQSYIFAIWAGRVWRKVA